jgi:hypothetical protein
MQRFTQQARHFQEMVRGSTILSHSLPDHCITSLSITGLTLLHNTQKVANEILEQESKLHLEEVATMKKQQLSTTRTIQKLKETSDREQLEWKEHTNRVIDELRQENLHLQKIHELAQVRHEHPAGLRLSAASPVVPSAHRRCRSAAVSGRRGAWS